jgi:putative peptide zinc metalloprotease protein
VAGQHMASGLPRLRSDLDRRRQTTAKGTTFVIKDPANGEFFRLQEVEGFVAEQLDGETPLETVQGRVEERFGAKLAPDVLAGFVRNLDRNGLLDTERGTRARRRKRRGRAAGGILNLRFKLIDPERLLNRLIHRVRFFFTPRFVFLSAGLIVAAMAVWIFNWNEILHASSQLIRLSTLPLLVVTIFATITAHELAHGLTCKHFGGEVREMGFMLLYFQPAFYCNVSDAWLFPEKSKRLWVGFAGPYFELFLWALATLVWSVTDTDTWINRVSLVVMATSGVKTLFNFNPLIKLDGYYLLSDYLDIPNLRQKSFAYLGDFLKRLAGLTDRRPELSPREQRIYLAYGLTAWAFSVSLLGYLGLMFGEYFIVEGERLAFLALATLIGFRLRGKFASLFGRGSRDSKSPDSKSSVWLKLKAAFLKPRALKLATTGGVMALFLFALPIELRVAGPVNVLPYHNADVRAEIGGTIAEIHVDEGQRVSRGDLIARLSDREHRAELQKTEAEIQQVQARLDQLIVGPTKQEIEVARSAVTTARDRLKFARAKRARLEALVTEQLVSQNDFDAARELEAAADNELAEANSKLRVLLKGTRPEEIMAAQAELARLTAQQSYLEWQLERVEVRSPATGVVTTPSRQLRAMLRQVVPKGGLIAKVHELKTITVEAAISEKEIADVKIGQTIGIKTRAYPDRVFYGKVVAIATTTQGSSASGSDPSGVAAPGADAPAGADRAAAVRVTTEIDNSAGLLKPGMTGMAKIYCGERRMIDLVTRRLSRTFRVEFWSWW